MGLKINFCARLLILYACCLPCSSSLPHIVVDLDRDPIDRWEEPLRTFASYGSALDQVYDDLLPKPLREFLEAYGDNIVRAIREPFRSELVGVSAALNVSLYRVVALNVVYELKEFCTSIIAERDDGSMMLARNLDYDSSAIFKKIALDVSFISNGTVKIRGGIFLGSIGLFTGFIPGVAAVSVNARAEGGMLANLVEFLLDPVAQFVSFNVRQTLESAHNYDEVVRLLSTSHLIAECYFAVVGNIPQQGVVITRDRIGVANVNTLDKTSGKWFLVQTNSDHWDPAKPPCPRYTVATERMNLLNSAQFTMADLVQVLSTWPVLNMATIETITLEVSEPDSFECFVRD